MTVSATAERQLKVAMGSNAGGQEIVDAINNVLASDSIVDSITASADEINYKCDGQPSRATISAAAGSSNVCEITITIKDGNGTAVTGPVVFDVLLSDAATGAGLTATTASGTVAAKASSGTDLSTLVSKKALKVQSKADGTYILSITDNAKTGFYPVVQIPGLKAIVGTQLVSGNYG